MSETISQEIIQAELKRRGEVELWKRGELEFLLYDYQKPVYRAVKKAMKDGNLKYVLNCARRFGGRNPLAPAIGPGSSSSLGNSPWWNPASSLPRPGAQKDQMIHSLIARKQVEPG